MSLTLNQVILGGGDPLAGHRKTRRRRRRTVKAVSGLSDIDGGTRETIIHINNM